ncbi:hypothetical protein [Ralstonia solanacearum]|uniref:hypothetical protein n=1 Tax=Ralstonia solanacearum TaxID=305 RepID=UPI0018D19FA7|nr:hypothetical protein [Ralstonia solanacearum]
MSQPVHSVVHGPLTRDGAHTQGAAPAEPAAASTARERVETALGEPEHEVESFVHGACLPHERDQYVAEQGSGPRDKIEQAARDIESGLLDTDLHDTQGLECVVRERHAAGNSDPDRDLANRTADANERNRRMPGAPSSPAGERKR